MSSYGDMRDAYSSIYQKKEDKRYPTGWLLTNAVNEALDFLLDNDIITEEEMELLEMRKQDKVAGKKSGGSDDPMVRAISKAKKAMTGGQQKKQIPGDKKRHTQVKTGPTPLQMLQTKKRRQRDAQSMMHSPRD